MKKFIFAITTSILMLALAIPMAMPVLAQTDSDLIYGITTTGEIHAIDPINQTWAVIAQTDECDTSHPSGPNGLAYDQDTNRIYYTNYPATQTYLYFIDLDTGVETYVGEVPGEIACADIYDGHYYYIAGGTETVFTDMLYKIELLADGMMGAIESFSISGGEHRWGFWGDIAIQDGVIYGWGHCKVSGHNHEFFSVNIDGTGFKIIQSGLTQSLQLAFGLDGVMYGHNFINGHTFEISWTDTTVTTTYLYTSEPRYTDMASGKTSSAETYSICGYKFADWEDQLIALPDWEIILEIWDGYEFVFYSSTNTGSDGKYCFDGLPAGTYKITEYLKTGWEQLLPGPGAYIVELPGGETYTEEYTVLYGTQRNNPGNNGLYVINLDTMAADRLFNAGGSGNSPNGLGFDPVNNRLYYMNVTEPNGPSALYFYDIETDTATAAGLNLPGQVVVGASFYDGAFYYIPNLTADLHKVTLNVDGTVDQDMILWANFNGDNPAVYRFGDFAINRDGILYASTNATGGSTAEFFKLNVITGEYTLIADANTPGAALLLQVSFGSDGTLYGHSAGSGEFFTIDLVTGTTTSVGYVESDLRTRELFSDLASGTQPKYYNFINTPEMICFDQTAWAWGGEDIATANNTVEGNPSNAWGWTNYFGEAAKFPVVMELWAAAGQNDFDNGFLVGTVTVDFDGSCVTVTYDIVDSEGMGWTISEAHLWVGDTPLPTSESNRGRTTVITATAAPGQLGNQPEIEIDGLSATITLCDFELPFYVAAHAVIEWCEPDPGALAEIEAVLAALE